jgi:glutathione peroxidase
MTKKPTSIYDIQCKTIDGEIISMGRYKEKVILIVNTASRCGYTGQYDGLQKLHKKFEDQGLIVLGFPCNQFGKQEPGSVAEIHSFCKINFGVTFQLFAKVEVNGENAHPLFMHLKHKKRGLLGSKNIKWNFTKFLVDKEGNVVNRYHSAKKPASLEKDIKKLLAK